MEASVIEEDLNETMVKDAGAVTDASGNISEETEIKEKKSKKKKKKKKGKKRTDTKKGEEVTQLTSRNDRKNGRTQEDAKRNPRLWIRLANEKKEIYYYNIFTEAYSWLAPCSICGEMSQKWCNECVKSFCDAHYSFAASHKDSTSTAMTEKGSAEENQKGTDLRGSMSIGGLFQAAASASKVFSAGPTATDHGHTWQDLEPYVKEELPPPPPNTPGITGRSPMTEKSESERKGRRSNALRPAYCLLCQLRVAEKLCTECWDPYCAPCFRGVHHVGSLLLHKTISYQKACLGWVCIRAYGNGDDYYVHGPTGETTYEKPFALLNPREQELWKKFQKCKAAVDDTVQTLEGLHYDNEKFKYERDLIIADLLDGGDAKKKAAKGKDQKRGSSSANGGTSKGKKSFLASFTEMLSFSGVDLLYKDNLLNPSDRRRGQARTENLKKLLEEPDK